MLNELFEIQKSVLSTVSNQYERYLFSKVNWKDRAIAFFGGRGVGKTTLMCQYLLKNYQEATEALYISADNVVVVSQGLFSIAQEFFKYGGKALFIDEVHKYQNWQQEIKNIIDTFGKHQIIFSGSSASELKKSKYDFSRRVIYYELNGLSFREFLQFNKVSTCPVLTLENIFQNHLKICDELRIPIVLKHFQDYLKEGYYPFFLEGLESYLLKVTNIIEKIIYEDIAVVYNLKQSTLPILKKILWLIATSKGLSPNIDKISKNLQVSREVVYSGLEYLEQSGIINNVYFDAKGMKLVRKPGKVYLENTNFINAINGSLKIANDSGIIRETFFVNQLLSLYSLKLHDSADFIVDEKYIIEVGGKSKGSQQLRNEKHSFLVLDGIEIGFGNKIPLYLFGFLY